MGTVPVIPTFVSGQIVTAGQLNQLSAALTFGLYNRPICKVHQTVAQSIITSSYRIITFDVTDVDTDLGRSGTGAGTDRYVCRTQGWYTFLATVGYASTSSVGARFAVVNINGVTQNGYGGYGASPTTNTGVTLGGLIHMNVGDYLTVLAFQDTGSNLNTAVAPGFQASSLSLQFEIAG